MNELAQESPLTPKNQDTNKEEIEGLNSYGISKENINGIFSAYEIGNRAEEFNLIERYDGDRGIGNKLDSDPQNGIMNLDEKEKLRRKKEFDSNEKEVEEVPNCCVYVMDGLADLMIRLLIFAAIVQIILGSIPAISEDPSREWVEGFSILIAVTIVVSVGSYTNWSKEKKFKSLNDTKKDQEIFQVIRNGEIKPLHPDFLLVGDVVLIKYGKILPADGILISGNSIEIDESALTGESKKITKNIFSECLKIKLETEKKNSNLDDIKKLITEKDNYPSCLMLSGTKVESGDGRYMVLRVGKNSLKGQIEEKVIQSQQSGDSKTPLEEKLDKIAGDIGRFGMLAALLTLIALFIRFGVSFSGAKVQYSQYILKNQTEYEKAASNGEIFIPAIPIEDPNSTIGSSILKIILLCVAIIVVAIPEGLPLAVTLSLAFAIGKMMEAKNLVRKMPACETMGSANYICTDKTGTLTQNKMCVNNIFDCKMDYLIVPTVNNSKKLTVQEIFPNAEYKKLFTLSLSLNLTIELVVEKDSDELGAASRKIPASDSNATDLCFYHYISENLGEDYEDLKRRYNALDKMNLKQIPFDSERKCMTTIIESEEFPKKIRVFHKGASEKILNKVTHYTDPNTLEVIEINDVYRTKLISEIKSYADNSLRTIAFAYKDITHEESENYKNTDEQGNKIIEKSDYILVCIIGIKDTLREGVVEAVRECTNAGIKIIMVTGDHENTAVAIAKECGILAKEYSDDSHMEGITFNNLIGGLFCEICKKDIGNDIPDSCLCPVTKNQAKSRGVEESLIRKDKIKNMEKFEKILKDLRVLARSRPIDKYMLVLGLRSLDNVVAVTGDGTNDAQALSKADVGFSMGIAGTDIAKDASDIMIMDDNFKSTVTAVLYGRNIFDCIRKFIQFQLTVNVCACLLVFICGCIGNETPLTAIQMLWVNLIMDSLGSLALATEPPSLKLLQRKPYKRSEYIINVKMWKHIIIQAFVQLGILLFLYLHAPQFIRENDPYKIAEADLINLCFGKYPGQKPDELGYFILDGSVNAWNSDVTRIIGFSKDQCGDYGSKNTLFDALHLFSLNNGNTSHMTIVFNTFVFATLFNQLNSRVIDDSFNIFMDILKNPIFIFIEFIEFGLQAALIQIGSAAFKVSRGGLTGDQWGICLGFASITFFMNFFIKFIPDSFVMAVYNCCICKRKKNKIADLQTEEMKDLQKSEHDKLNNNSNNHVELNVMNNHHIGDHSKKQSSKSEFNKMFLEKKGSKRLPSTKLQFANKEN